MLEYQVKLGPRPAGSAQSRKLAAYIKARLPRGRYENLPGGLRNVVGEIPGKGKPILLAAHYDTKDIDGFVGANDGAGGTAALLELARVLQRTKRPANAPPIRFIAFDGEEATDDNDFYGTGLRGSKPYARKQRAHAARGRADGLHRRQGPRDPARGVLGRGDVGRPARAPRRTSARAPRSRTRRRATVLDDHTPFVRARRAVDRPDRLHVRLLAPDLRRHAARCPSASLDMSGETVLEFLTMDR